MKEKCDFVLRTGPEGNDPDCPKCGRLFEQIIIYQHYNFHTGKCGFKKINMIGFIVQEVDFVKGHSISHKIYQHHSF